MNRTRKAVMGVALVGSTLVGGGIGAALFASNGASAQTSSPSTTTPAPQYGVQPNGKFVPNEDPTHEQGESAQREAQENAGQVPTVP
jgi:hypothetical protein